jgi:hypothetical protein
LETPIELDTLLDYLRQEVERIDQQIITLQLMALTPGALLGGLGVARRAADRSAGHVRVRKAWSTHRIRRD